MRTLDQLAADPTLREAGWDSYGAMPLQDGPIAEARLFLGRMSVVPTGEGGVMLEWHTHGATFDVEFHSDGRTTFFLSDPEVKRCLCIPEDEQAPGVDGGHRESSPPVLDEFK